MHEQYTYHDNKRQQREGAREQRVFKNNTISNGYKIRDFFSSNLVQKITITNGKHYYSDTIDV